MANPEHVALVKGAYESFAVWRQMNYGVTLDLSDADLSGADLRGRNLYRVNLRGARLCRAAPTPFMEDMSGDPPGAMDSFMKEVHSPMGDEITVERIEQGKRDSRWLPEPFIVHGTVKKSANLSAVRLEQADLRMTDLSYASLVGADLTAARLEHAKLTHADLTGARLDRAKLAGADISHANLTAASLSRAELEDINAVGTVFRRADLSHAILTGAMLHDADLSAADASGVNLTGAQLQGTDMSRAHLHRACLEHAQLEGASLELANLVEARIGSANFGACHVYGVSAWGLIGEPMMERGVIITPAGGSVVTTDGIRVAQFIHLLLKNSEFRRVIDAVTSKVVLILGRFSDDRKPVLDTIREELRKLNLAPVVFDFHKPASKDVTGTVETLARMARFVLADVTDPSSIPHELATIVPHLRTTPVLPLRLKGTMGYTLLADYQRDTPHRVFATHEYESPSQLIAQLPELITPLNKRAEELRHPPTNP